MAALAFDWLRYFQLLLWNRWKEFNKIWQEARYQYPLLSLCFSGWLENQDCCPGLWLAETFSKILWNGWKEFNETWQEAKSQCPLPSLCFSGQSEKQDGHPILWLAETFSTSPLKPLLKWNSRKLDRKQDLNVLYQVCVFWAHRKNKMAAPASDWMRHYQLLLWNGWMEFNKT